MHLLPRRLATVDHNRGFVPARLPYDASLKGRTTVSRRYAARGLLGMGIGVPPAGAFGLAGGGGAATDFFHFYCRQRLKILGGGKGLILFIGEAQAEQRDIGVDGEGIV